MSPDRFNLPPHPCDEHAEVIDPATLRRLTYASLRARGWTASAAFRASETFRELAGLTEAGTAGVYVCVDPEGFDAGSYDLPEADVRRERERAGRDGVWGLCAAAVDGGELVRGDECWGFIGDDATEPGTLLDFARDAVRLGRIARERITFAGFED